MGPLKKYYSVKIRATAKLLREVEIVTTGYGHL